MNEFESSRRGTVWKFAEPDKSKEMLSSCQTLTALLNVDLFLLERSRHCSASKVDAGYASCLEYPLLSLVQLIHLFFNHLTQAFGHTDVRLGHRNGKSPLTLFEPDPISHQPVV